MIPFNNNIQSYHPILYSFPSNSSGLEERIITKIVKFIYLSKIILFNETEIIIIIIVIPDSNFHGQI